MSKSHSKYPPSSAYRWLNCSASALLPEDEVERDTTAADEGTLAHKIAELKLTRDFWNDNEEELEECRANLLYKTDMEYFTDEYSTFVQNFNVIPIVEIKLDLSKYMEGLFGTCDCIVFDQLKREINVIDFKYGYGKVEAKNNPQLMFYALGATDLILQKFPSVNPEELKITVIIYQPRIRHIDSQSFTYSKLTDWYESVKPAIQKVLSQQVERNTGSWCKYCDKQIHCREYQNELMEAYVTDFFSLSEDEIVKNYEKLKDAEQLAKKIRDYLVKELQSGSVVKGYKLQEVNSKSWSNKEIVEEIAKEHGLVNTMSPAQALRKLGKKEFDSLLGEYVSVKPGSPKLIKEKE